MFDLFIYFQFVSKKEDIHYKRLSAKDLFF